MPSLLDRLHLSRPLERLHLKKPTPAIKPGAKISRPTHRIFGAIIKDDVEEVFRLLETDPKAMNARNDDGAAPVHVAFLFGKYELGKEMVHKFPQCTLYTYEQETYEGENILHIVIVQRAYDMVEWLLESHPALLQAEALGKFFKPGGKAYFGGLPLLFAVSTNQINIVQRILDTTSRDALYNDLNCHDHYKNTALHMAVIHDLVEMYEFILEIEKNYTAPGHVPLSWRENDEHMTPLALAAAMGRVQLFKRIIARGTVVAWTYGPITCRKVPLRGIEQPFLDDLSGTPQTKTKKAKVSVEDLKRMRVGHGHLALECMCASSDDRFTECLKGDAIDDEYITKVVYKGRLQMIDLPEIRGILDEKWKTFGSKRFKRDFWTVIMVMVFWTAAIIIPKSYVETPDNIAAYPVNNAFILLFESLVLLWVLWTLGNEGLRLFRARRAYFKGIYGVVAVMYWLEIVFCILVLVLVGLRAGQQQQAGEVFTALASVTGWLIVLAYMVVVQKTGRFIILLQEMIIHDIRRFGIVYITVLIGFTTAVHVVNPANTDPGNNAVDYWKTFRYLFIMGMVGDMGGFQDPYDGDYPWLLNLLLVLYLIFQVIIMVNILIAMMGKTYGDVIKDAESRFYVQRNILLTFYEAETSVSDMYEVRRGYSAPQDPQDNDDLDADLYYEVSNVSEDWKKEVNFQEKQCVEERKRMNLWKEEEDTFAAIMHQFWAERHIIQPSSPQSPHHLGKHHAGGAKGVHKPPGKHNAGADAGYGKPRRQSQDAGQGDKATELPKPSGMGEPSAAGPSEGASKVPPDPATLPPIPPFKPADPDDGDDNEMVPILQPRKTAVLNPERMQGHLTPVLSVVHRRKGPLAPRRIREEKG